MQCNIEKRYKMFKVLQSMFNGLVSSLQPQTSLMSFFVAEYKRDAKYAYDYFITTGKLNYHN